MDPNANLQEQEECLAALSVLEFDDERAEWADRLADLRSDLGEWLRGGGFEPRWRKAPKAAEHYGH